MRGRQHPTHWLTPLVPATALGPRDLKPGTRSSTWVSHLGVRDQCPRAGPCCLAECTLVASCIQCMELGPGARQGGPSSNLMVHLLACPHLCIQPVVAHLPLPWVSLKLGAQVQGETRELGPWPHLQMNVPWPTGDPGQCSPALRGLCHLSSPPGCSLSRASSIDPLGSLHSSQE